VGRERRRRRRRWKNKVGDKDEPKSRKVKPKTENDVKMTRPAGGKVKCNERKKSTPDRR
jgi:hypothetical protein